MLIALLVASFYASFWLFTRSNHSPYLYHPDEPEKAAQVYRNYRNYRHPQLLLEVSTAATTLLGTPDDPQATAEVGRDVSAAFAAMAVTLLAMLGYQVAGLGGAIAAALLVGTCPFLLVNAHYMKEDCALIMGLAMVAVAAVQMIRADSPGRRFCAAGLLGFACAVATSAKYVGVMTVLPAIPLVLGRRPWWSRATLHRLAVFFIAFFIETLAINYRTLFELGIFANSMKWHGATPLLGHAGVKMVFPSAYYLIVIHRQVGWHVEALLAMTIFVIVWSRRLRTLDYLTPTIFAMLCTVPLLVCRSAFPRYALPAIVLLTFCGAIGLVWMSQRVAPPWRNFAVAVILLACTWLQFRACQRHIAQFENDSRDRLRQWMVAHLPTGSHIAADTYAGRFIAFGGRQAMTLRDGVTMHAALSAADLGSIDDLRAAGFTHVAVSAEAFDRYFDPRLHALPGKENEYAARQRWYRELFERGHLIWRSDPVVDSMGYTDPALRLYALTDARVSSVDGDAAPQ